MTNQLRGLAIAALLFACGGVVEGDGSEDEVLGTDEGAATAPTTLKVLSGRCLDASAPGTSPGTRTQIWDCGSANNQKWVLPAVGVQGPIKTPGGLCLDVSGANSANETPAIIYTCHGGANQQWTVNANGAVTGLAGKCLDVSGSKDVNGTRVQLYTCNGTGAQKWTAGTGTTTPPPSTTDSKFSLIVFPDTQQEVFVQDGILGKRFKNRTQWVANNRSALDVRFVLHTGDMANWDTADHSQYVAASDAFRTLDTARIPYAIAIGNHDTAATKEGGSAAPGNVNTNLRNTTTFNRYFPVSRFQNFMEAYETGKIDNAFHTFNAGGLNWLVLNHEVWPRTGAIEWAKTVLSRFPHHNVIIITHAHLNADSSTQQNNGGYGNNSPQFVYDQLYSQYANVRFIFSGHVGNSGFRQNTGVKGNTFFQFLNCYHDNVGNPLRIVEIDTARNTVNTHVYSPYNDSERSDGQKSLTGVNFVQ